MSSFASIVSIYFEQVFAQLSCVMLGSSRDLMLEHLIHTFPMRESHLKAIIIASVEMDISKLKRLDNDGLDVYLEKLMLIPSNGSGLNGSRNICKNLNHSTPDAVSRDEGDNWEDGGFSVTAIQELEKRQVAVSCSSAVEAGLENIWKTLGRRMNDELCSASHSEPPKHSTM